MANTKFGLGAKFLKQLAKEVDEGLRVGDMPAVKGQPASANIPGVGTVELGGTKAIKESAQKVTESKGLKYNPPEEYIKADPIQGAKTAEAYAQMKHDPDNPEVHRAYQALADETVAMYEQMLEDGVKPYFIGKKDPYAASPYMSLLELSRNKSLGAFPTRSGFGSDASFDPTGSPLLAESGYFINGEPALINDLFRLVHDYYGHASKGVGFRASGEKNAFLEHFAMFGPLARRAAASETDGQNSWLNFGPNAAINQTAKIGDTIFADQKTGLMSNEIIMQSTQAQKIRQKRIEQILKGDPRGLQGALGKDGSFELIHWSHEPLDVIDPEFQHTGIGKRVRDEVNRLSDDRAPKRSSFGIENVDKPYVRESGLGDVKNKVRIPAAQMYDLVNDPDNLKATLDPDDYGSPAEMTTLLERAIKENGYTGYFAKHPSLGAVAQLFDPVKTETGKALGNSQKGMIKGLTIPLMNAGAALAALSALSYSREADAGLPLTIAQQAAKTFKANFGGTSITLAKEAPAAAFYSMHRPDQIIPNRALYSMGYLTDESLMKNINDPAAMKDYIRKREKALLKDLQDRPGLASKYDLMAQNDFADVYEKLERVKTPVVSPESLKGKVITSTMSDLSGTVKTDMIGGIPAKSEHHGGTGFTSLVDNAENNIGWASTYKAMAGKSDQVERIMQDTGKQAILVPTGMSDTGLNFISPLSKVLAEQTQQIQIPKVIKNAFDRTFRKQNPDWVGLDDPRAPLQISGKDIDGAPALSADARKQFVQMISSGGLQKFGFPSYLNAVRVLSKKGFSDLEIGESRKFLIPRAGGSEQNIVLGVGNDTYNAGLLIDGFGQLADNIPAEIMFRDQYKKMSKEMSDGKGPPRLLRHNEIVNKIMTMNDIYQDVDQEWIDNVSNYLKDKAAKREYLTGQEGKVDPGALAAMFGLSMMAIAASPEAEAMPFIGKYAKNFKKDILDKALEMEKAGATREEIWKTTGEQGQPMFRNIKDKMWRAEIPSDKATANLSKIPMSALTPEHDVAASYARKKGWVKNNLPGISAINQLATLTDDQAEEAIKFAKKQLQTLKKNPDLQSARLDEVLDYPELFDNYPELGSVKVQEFLDRQAQGQWNERINTISLKTKSDSKNNITDTLFHEVNHAIESMEGFARGGQPESFSTKNTPLNPQLRLRNRIKVLDGLEKTGYKLSDVRTKSFGVNDASNDTGYEMNDGKLVTLEDMGITINQFKKQPITGGETKHLYEDKDFIKGLMEFEQAKTKDPHKRQKNYERLVGEAQSRLVERRRGLTEQEIIDNPPFLPREQSEGYNAAAANREKNALRFDIPEEDQLLSDAFEKGSLAPFSSKSTDARVLTDQQKFGMSKAHESQQKHLEAMMKKEELLLAGNPPDDPRNTLEAVQAEIENTLDVATRDLGPRELPKTPEVIPNDTLEELADQEKLLMENIRQRRADGKGVTLANNALNRIRKEMAELGGESTAKTFDNKVVAIGTAGAASVGAGTVLAEPAQETTLGQRLFPQEEVVSEVIDETPEVNQSRSEAARRYVESKTGIPLEKIINVGGIAYDAVSEMATGDKRSAALPEDVRNLPEIGENLSAIGTGDFMADAKISAGLLATMDPAQRMNIIKANMPGVRFIPHGDPEDPIIEIVRPDGKRELLNRPGFSSSDAQSLGAMGLAYTPAGRVAGRAYSAGLPLANQMIRTGGATTLTNAALQETAKQAGSGVDVNVNDALAEGGFAALFPPAAAAWKYLKGNRTDLVDPVEEVLKKALPNSIAGPQ